MYSPLNCKVIVLLGSLGLAPGSAFLPSSGGHLPARGAPQRAPSVAISKQVPFPSTALRLVMDPPMKGDEKKKERNDDENSKSDWIPSDNGGFIPIIRARLGLRKKPSDEQQTPRPSQAAVRVPKVKEVLDIQQYKTEVADVRDQMVCVRFYAPWCKSCKAIEASFRRLPRDFPGVKFVEVPVLKDNAYLHKGLGVPSLPFAHIYHPETGLVEERKINKNVFAEFKEVLRTYVGGECQVQYDDDGICIPL